MKFYCDACNTKYAISDDKVRGKVLKVRCKKCGHIITVRENTAPVAAAAAAAPKPAAPKPPAPAARPKIPQENWYYALNGATTGPFGLAELREKYASGEVGDETYVWHDTFPAWKPVTEVEAFAEALKKGQERKPRPKTLGFTGPVQAIDASAGPAEQPEKEQAHELHTADVLRSEAEPEARASEEERPGEPTPSQAAKTPAAHEADDEEEESPQVRKDRLDKLRARLKNKSGSRPLPSRPALPKKATEDASEDELDLSGVLGDEPLGDEASDEADDAHAPQVDPVADTEAPVGSMFGGEVGSITSHDADDSASISFDLPPAAGAAAAASPGASASDESAEEPAEQSEADEHDDDAGAVPFFPEAPKLSSSAPGTAGPSPTDSITGSLLIQLDQIKKKGRGKLAVGVLAAVLILGGVIGGGVYMGIVNPKEELVVEAAPKVEQRDELVFRTYSKSEQKRIAQIDLGAEVITEADLAEAEQVEEAEAREPKPSSSKPSPKPDAFEAAVASARRARAEREAAEASEAKEVKQEAAEASGSGRFEKARIARAAEPAAAADSASDEPAAPDEEEKVTAKSVLAYRAAASAPSREAAVMRPDDPLAAKQQAGGELTRDMAVAGFKKVRRSVALCRERHMRRGAKLDAQKIYVTVEVQGDGQVTKFSAKPKSVQNTTFEQCMQSHKGRWRFPPYGGKPTTINSSFIIQ